LGLLYGGGISNEELYREHVKWAERFCEPLAGKERPHANSKVAGRRLRVGYVSPDFRAHPVPRFFEPLLAGRDKEGFEVFCYNDLVKADGVTKRLKRYVDAWREVAGLPDEQLADLIRADGIDILVD